MDGQHNLVLDQVTVSAVVVFLIQTMKHSEWPIFQWIRDDTPKISRALAIASSALVAIGLHWTWDPSSRLFAIYIPPIAILLQAAIPAASHWIRSMVWQELLYRGVANNGLAKIVREAVAAAIAAHNAPVAGAIGAPAAVAAKAPPPIAKP